MVLRVAALAKVFKAKHANELIEINVVVTIFVVVLVQKPFDFFDGVVTAELLHG